MQFKFLLSMVVAFVVGGLAPSANAQFSKPSQAEQVKLGKRAAAEIRQKEKILPASDPRVQTVRRIAGRLLANLDDKNAPWEYSFDVIDDKDVNAFALPGGPTFVYTGLLEKVKSEDELAAVMGHELTHVRREHWAYQYRDEQQRNIGISLLLILGRANKTISNLASIGSDVLISLPYSRGHEIEADDGGYEMMVKAGFNPEGMVDLFNTLKTSGGSKPPEWLSTHPADGSRVKRVENKIKDSSEKYPALTPMNYDYYKNWSKNKKGPVGGG